MPKLTPKGAVWGRKCVPGVKAAPLILSNPSIDFLSFSVFRGPKNVENQGGERFELEAQNLSILGVIWGSLGGHFGSIFGGRGSHFPDLFLECFLDDPRGDPRWPKWCPRGPFHRSRVERLEQFHFVGSVWGGRGGTTKQPKPATLG